MRIRCLLTILLAFYVCSAKEDEQSWKEIFKNTKTGSYYLWPVFFGGGTFFFTLASIDEHWPGYSLSGGGTFSMNKDKLFFLADALYSYRSYEGFPQYLHYEIGETTADLALAAGYDIYYLGGYVQFPLTTKPTKLRVREWTMEDFDGISRSTSFSLMGGARIVKKNFGFDLRLLLGQGPGQFLSKDFGDHWLGQISLGFMGGF
jgi:hypothetical protein